MYDIDMIFFIIIIIFFLSIDILLAVPVRDILSSCRQWGGLQ